METDENGASANVGGVAILLVFAVGMALIRWFSGQ